MMTVRRRQMESWAEHWMIRNVFKMNVNSKQLLSGYTLYSIEASWEHKQGWDWAPGRMTLNNPLIQPHLSKIWRTPFDERLIMSRWFCWLGAALCQYISRVKWTTRDWPHKFPVLLTRSYSAVLWDIMNSLNSQQWYKRVPVNQF